MVGFGFSDRPQGVDYGLDTWANQTVGLMDTLGIQKAHLVKQVAVEYKKLDIADEEKSPADVRALAERCKRANEANRRMLILTVQCINGLLESAGYGKPAKYGPGADGPARRRMMDLRV